MTNKQIIDKCPISEKCKEFENCKIQNILQQLKRKEQECEELKGCLFQVQNATISLTKQLDQLKAENEELKEKIKSYICSTNCYKYQEADKYKQALKEIKEIADGMHDLWINKSPYTDTDNLVVHLLECELNRIRYKFDDISEVIDD